MSFNTGSSYGGLCRESSLHETRDAETNRTRSLGRTEERKGPRHILHWIGADCHRGEVATDASP
jgi:hypothetical protein